MADAAMPLAVFATAGLQITVESDHLGETVIFLSDNAVSDRAEKRVAYRACELEKLIGLSPESLRRVHEVKKMFDGRVG